MKTPAWAYVIGFLMLFFGFWGAYNDLEYIQKSANQEIIVADSLSSDEQLKTETQQLSKKEKIKNSIQENVNKAFEKTEHTKVWMLRFAYLGIFLALFYVLAGFFLLIPKNFSLALAFTILGLSMLISIIEARVLWTAPNFNLASIAAGFKQVSGIIIDGLFLIIVAASDKSVYFRLMKKTKENAN